ncbi:MAG: roadblock/LC7 domain-containing protein [Actinomycetota bacterium]
MSDRVPSLSARLDQVLADLLGRTPELEAAAVVSVDGLAMAAALPDGMDEDRVAAMSAALLMLGERAAEGLGRGPLAQVYVEGEAGSVCLVAAGDEAVLVGVAVPGAKAGLVRYETRQAAAALAAVLRAPEPAPAYAEPVPVPAQAEPEPAPAYAVPAPAYAESAPSNGTGQPAGDLAGDLDSVRWTEYYAAGVEQPDSW